MSNDHSQEEAFGHLTGLSTSGSSRRHGSSEDSNVIQLDKTFSMLQLERTRSSGSQGSVRNNSLKKLLSTQSGISTASSYAEFQNAAVGQIAAFREIGRGSIGKIFEQPGTTWAYKLPLLDRSGKLWNNYIMHLRIQNSFDKLGKLSGRVELPRVSWFADKNSAFWRDNLSLFPDDPTFRREPRDILCMERVLPLPEPVRNALIETYCPPQNVDNAKRDLKNKDCLVMIFLGRKRIGTSRPGGTSFFSLRNYKLHLDQVRELDLDASEYAGSMADTLAILHWHTKVDGNDIEFVLGSSPADRKAIRREMRIGDVERLAPGSSTYEYVTNSNPNFKKRLINLWVLDFDACKPITMDENGVRLAVRAFMDTDPYCPRPSMGDQFAEQLWNVFCTRYTQTAARLVRGTSYHHLPQRFIEGVANEVRRRGEQRGVSQSTPNTPPVAAGRGGSPLIRARSRGTLMGRGRGGNGRGMGGGEGLTGGQTGQRGQRGNPRGNIGNGHSGRGSTGQAGIGPSRGIGQRRNPC
ncbi:hypothetical protein FQN49_005255 [Arthroderma sp. PD_2]|nr:hypothetical protein FQN49_005255 [Arthroderma sp. PD_2]